MKVITIPTLKDNYAYLLIDSRQNVAAAIDPVLDPSLLSSLLKKEGNPTLQYVLSTHHHSDHSGGNRHVKKAYPSVTIVGGDDRVEAVDWILKELTHGNAETKRRGWLEPIPFGSLQIYPICTPCHTQSHLCYYVDSDPTDQESEKVVFTGDTLFIAGCGRFFEGDGKQMCQALIDRLGALPERTQVFCGHEYTIANVAFAMTIEPENDSLRRLQERLIPGQQTVPSTIGQEKQTNPFMRVSEYLSNVDLYQKVIPRILSSTTELPSGKSIGREELMDRLREMKNKF